MSRRQRLHVPGGFYYVVQRGNAHQPIFSAPEEYALWERLLAATLRRTSARLHAYCWIAEEIHMALQIREIPVGRIMQGLTGRYARTVHARAGTSGHFFAQRYQAALIDPDEYLPRLVRYIHHIPVRVGLASVLRRSHSS